MKYFVGIDVGTSGTKSVAFDENGKIITDAYADYELIQPKNGWAEQRPNDWKNAAFETLRQITSKVDANDIMGIGVSGQMHGLVLLDEKNEPLCNSIIWCDQRTANETKLIDEVIGREKYISLTLNAPNTAFTLSKLLWVKQNMPEIYSKIHKVLLPKDYINFCLTGEFATDVSDAGGTGCFDVTQRKWSYEIIDAFGIDTNIFAPITESCQVVGRVNAEASEATGLSEKTVVVGGAGDQAAAALGNGIIQPGDMSVSLGTSGVVFSAIEKPAYDKLGRVHTFCHAVPGMWHIMGVTQGCGLSVNWYRNNFAKEFSYPQLDEQAEKVTSKGVLYLPYLMGERTPHNDPDCRGAFVGLCASHTGANIYRAVIEGVCSSLNDCYTIMKSIGLKPNNISVAGGGAKSKLWLQILADVFQHDISKNENSESGARGVAMLAAVGSGFYDDISCANSKMNTSNLSKVKYDESKNQYYTSLYSLYTKLYNCLKEVNCELSDMDF